MRLRHALAAAALALVANVAPLGSASADCNDPFARPDQVLDFHLRITRADWTALLASKVTNPDSQPTDSPACSEKFPKFQASFRCGHGRWMEVAVRKKKGEERGVEAFEKPPIKIDFTPPGAKEPTAFPPSFGALGFGALTLNNGQSNKYADTTAVLPVLQSEHVALRLLEDTQILAPKTAYATLTVHLDDDRVGTYHGVYIVIEDIDRRALRRRALSGSGRLDKSSTYNCSPGVEFDDGPPNAATAAFDAFMAKEPAAYAGRWVEQAERGLDVDGSLVQEAAREILLNGSDTLFNSQNPPGWGNNWYAYDPPKGKRTFIPWDLDLAFGQQAGACQPTPLQCRPDVPLMSWCADGLRGPYAQTRSRLGQRLACHPELRARYLRTMCALIEGPLSAQAILRVWNQAFQTVAPIVRRERQLVWRGIDPLAAPSQPGVIETFGSENTRIAGWIPARIAWVRAELARLGAPCYGP